MSTSIKHVERATSFSAFPGEDADGKATPLSAGSVTMAEDGPSPGEEKAAHRAGEDWKVVSQYDVDDYGRPRFLSRWEVILHAMAWPVIVGVVIGFEVVISLSGLDHSAAAHPRETAAQAQVEKQ